MDFIFDRKPTYDTTSDTISPAAVHLDNEFMDDPDHLSAEIYNRHKDEPLLQSATGDARSAIRRAEYKAEDLGDRAEKRLKTAKDAVEDKAYYAREYASTTAADMKGNLEEKARDTKHYMRSAADQAKDATAYYADTIGEKAHDAKEYVKRTASNAKETVQEKAHDAKERMRSSTENLRESVEEKAHDAKEYLKSTAYSALGKAEEKIDDAREYMKPEDEKGLLEAAKDKIVDAYNAVTGKVEEVYESAKDTLSNVWEGAERRAEDAKAEFDADPNVRNAKASARAAKEDAADAARSTGQYISNKASETWEKTKASEARAERKVRDGVDRGLAKVEGKIEDARDKLH